MAPRSGKFLINTGLIGASTAIALAISNFCFLQIIRNGKQINNFPRSILSDLPAPSRWSYPDLGTTGTSEDIALIGDSYVEGSPDDYVNGLYKYSFAHFLHEYTGEPIANFGSSGSHLNKQLELYIASIKGQFWPLIDGREKEDFPYRRILFFYEGNDLDDYFNEKLEGGNEAQLNALKSNRKYQPLRLFLKSKWMQIKINMPKKTKQPKAIDSKPTSGKNRFCGATYCRTNYQMQSAAPNLNKNEIKEATEALAYAIAKFAKSDLPAKTCLVYIPSPATIYTVLPNINFEQSRYGNENRIGKISHEENESKSKMIRNQLKKLLLLNGMPFLDSTEYLKSAASHAYIHGEYDQKHFNEIGNMKIASYLADNLNKCFSAI